MPEFLAVLSIFGVALAVLASGHALLFRRYTRTSIAWIGLVWLAPFAGSLIYVLFGVNRLRRKGVKVQSKIDQELSRTANELPASDQAAFEQFPQYVPLIRLVENVTDLPLLAGNQVTPLVGGDQAYPAMHAAIDNAERSISIQSYIFDNDSAGQEFVKRLSAAMERGVKVRVLIDDVGSRYSRPPLTVLLREAGIPFGTFLPTRSPLSVSYANLRNHRKILVVDGAIGFTGGMNIRERCCVEHYKKDAVDDLHFQIVGPVVGQLQHTFAADWTFTTGEELANVEWRETATEQGDVWARGVPDGPDEDLGQLPLTIQGAISVARERIDIVTPYFLPDESILDALTVASLRGVKVRIIVPKETNIRPVQWASAAIIESVLREGCEVYASAPPFDHTKLMLVDSLWSLVGSSNWDPRSLRLNFEFNVECYSAALSEELTQIVEAKIARSTAISSTQLAERPLLIILRDRIASLFTPYL